MAPARRVFEALISSHRIVLLTTPNPQRIFVAAGEWQFTWSWTEPPQVITRGTHQLAMGQGSDGDRQVIRYVIHNCGTFCAVDFEHVYNE